MESVELPLVADDGAHGNVKIEEFFSDDFLVVDDKDAEMEETESYDENFQTIPEKFETCTGKNDSNACVLFEDFPPLPPVHDIQELEWVSSFIHQNSSISEFLEDETQNPKPEKQKPDPKSMNQEPTQPLTVVPNPAKAKRSKLTKVVKKSWSSSASSSSSLTTSSTSSSSSYSSQLLVLSKLFNRFPPPVQNMKKKRGRKPKNLYQQQPSGRLVALNERRCTHCGSTKTPQWRAGPSGAKTLCNACGVRYKSGRLLPEYRPACSPSFSSKIHSNSHRKVLEMRKKRIETEEDGFGFC